MEVKNNFSIFIDLLGKKYFKLISKYPLLEIRNHTRFNNEIYRFEPLRLFFCGLALVPPAFLLQLSPISGLS